MKKLICMVILSVMLTGCGREEKTEAVTENNAAENNATVIQDEVTGDIYDTMLDQLGENEYYAIIENNATYPILFVTDGVYDDGQGNQAALYSDVYYVVDGEVQEIGSVASGGTAYPISYDETGIYVAGGHYVAYYVMNEENGELEEKEVLHEIFDENGIGTYTKIIDGMEMTSSEEEIVAAFEKFGSATVVHFSRNGLK